MPTASILSTFGGSIDDDTESSSSNLEFVPLLELGSSSSSPRSSSTTNRRSLRHIRRRSLRPPPCFTLGLLLAATLVTFWLLDSLKDALLNLLTDGDLSHHQPTAKICSVVGTVITVAAFERVANVSNVRHGRKRIGGGAAIVRLFYCVVVPYALVFLCFAEAMRRHPSSLDNEFNVSVEVDSWKWTALGYFSFFLIESFCSLSVATFWMYANSTMSIIDARRGYGTIVALGQLGAFSGASLVSFGALGRFGYPVMFIWAFWGCILILSFITFHDRTYGASEYMKSEDDDKNFMIVDLDETASGSASILSTNATAKKTMEGVSMIFNDSYLCHLLGVSCLYEISITVIDYLMKVVGVEHSSAISSSAISADYDAFASLMGHFGQLTNLLSLILSWAGFSTIVRVTGLRRTLLLFPTALVAVTLLALAFPILPVLFVSMAVLKALTYGLHEPAKEILYIPTTPEAKVRAKFWIDVVGARLAKAMGSSIMAYSGNFRRARAFGSLPAAAAGIGLWIVCWRVGRVFEDLTDERRNHEHELLEMDSRGSASSEFMAEALQSPESETSEHEIFFRNNMADAKVRI